VKTHFSNQALGKNQRSFWTRLGAACTLAIPVRISQAEGATPTEAQIAKLIEAFTQAEASTKGSAFSVRLPSSAE